MRAALVSVQYADYLSICLPRNRHHFEQVLIVTTPTDHATIEIAIANGCHVFTTNAFYEREATFNKWIALERGLDDFGRHGIICIMDADVIWPQDIGDWKPQPGYLHTPYRRMLEEFTEIPEEKDWLNFPRHRIKGEFSGYTQIFHADDARLGPAPWHQIDWLHAGGADTFFQAKWPRIKRVRPPWEVLHLGRAGENWCGRSTPMLDGSVLPETQERSAKLREFMESRQQTRNYESEKLRQDRNLTH